MCAATACASSTNTKPRRRASSWPRAAGDCDATDAKVSVDGSWSRKVDGRRSARPATCRQRQCPGLPAEEQRIVATQSQKDRQLSFGDSRAAACEGNRGRPPPPPPLSARRWSRGWCWEAWAWALATSAGFGIAGFVQRGEPKTASLSEAAHDDVRPSSSGTCFLRRGCAGRDVDRSLPVVGNQPAPAKSTALRPEERFGWGASPRRRGRALHDLVSVCDHQVAVASGRRPFALRAPR
jgi:hypothetical protein